MKQINIKQRGHQTLTGSVVAVSVSTRKGMKKNNVNLGQLIENFGLKDDAHAANWHRQISLLAAESIQTIIDKGLDVKPGDFAENVTTRRLKLWELPIGTQLKLGSEALVRITQIGKVCHDRCAIYHQMGDCVMPRQDVFARVLTGDTIQLDDQIVEVKSEL